MGNLVGVVRDALEIAAAGIPVFPCASNKMPAIGKKEGGRGFLDATCDPGAVESFFGRANAQLIGVPTGQRWGVDALDLDYRHGGKDWEGAHSARLPETRIHQTQSGGRHYLFRHAPGVRNSASKIAPGVDVRGEGGYIVIPPSLGYSVISHAEIVDWPDWLLELILHRDAPKERPERSAPPAAIASKRIEAFVKSLLARVGTAPEGGKHFALRNAALSFGGILYATGYSDEQAVSALVGALPGSVVDWEGAKKTARWGIENGRRDPIELEDRPEYAERAKPLNGQHYEAAAEPSEAVADEEDPDLTFAVEFFRDIQPVTHARDFVEGLLLEGAMSVTYGESNSGKTFFATDLALHIACGWKWNDRETERGGVIYCALEGAHGIRNRIAAFRQEHGISDYDLPFGVIPVTMDMIAPGGDTDKLIRTIRSVGKKLAMPVKAVWMDTLSRAMAGGNENAPDDMGALVTNGTLIQQQTGAHVGWVHHSGKDQAKGARGHSLLRAATDTEIEITVEGPQRLARVSKQRDLECSGEFAFTLKVVELGTNHRGKPITSCVVDYGDSAALERGHAAGAASARRHLKGHNQRALGVLIDLCATSGEGGYLGTPAGTLSVPERWWRDRFYSSAMPGDSDEAKQKAFRRAAIELVNARLVGMANRRVWISRFTEAPVATDPA